MQGNTRPEIHDAYWFLNSPTVVAKGNLDYPIEGINWYLSDFFTVSAT